MPSTQTRRALVEIAALEARRLLCMAGDHVGFATTPAPEGWEPPVGDAASAVTVDILSVPAFSSRPSAPRKLYLDFNGHGAIDNWNGWWEFGGKNVTATPAYDIDGDLFSFSAQEQQNIQQIWKGVAEKFSPFNVDVTTIKPSKINGVRVVIGGDGAWYGSGGGVASIGGWGEEGFTDANSGNVAFVWANPGNTAYVAEAAAHETGHTLGLYHHSFSPIQSNEYAPGFIMGSGGKWASTSVNGTIATSRDDNTVVSEGSQDDLAKIVSGNGFTYRVDDAGATTTSAVVLNLVQQDGARQASFNGVIEQMPDLDLFRINHLGGSMNIEVRDAEFRGMLDPRLTLRNSSNVVIVSSSSNTAGGVSERIQFNNLDAGTYYIGVSGSGAYGDIGQYRLNIRAGQSTTTANDTLTTATQLGVYGRTESEWVALGFAGTAVINDSLTSTDSFDFFRFVTPAHTRQVFVQLGGLTTTASLALYQDTNANGVVETGEILFATNPQVGTQSFNFTNAAGLTNYYVRVARGPSAPAGNYQLRIVADAAPSSLPASTQQASFDPAPLMGARLVYASIDQPAGDTVDYYRVTAQRAGLLSVTIFDAQADLRLDVGNDANGNGVFDAGEILVSGTQIGNGNEQLQNITIAQGQTLLVRVWQQQAGATTNYAIRAIADYATGGNTTGSLLNPRDLTNRAAGAVTDYLDGFDIFDTYRINPQVGAMQVTITGLSPGASHRLDLIRDANFNNVVDAGEIVATGGGTLTHNVTAGANYFIRCAAQLFGEFFTSGNYRMSYVTAGATTGFNTGAPGLISVGSSPSSTGGYMGFDPDVAALTDLDDHFQFTIAARTRFDASINDPSMGLQVGVLDAQRNFQRLGGLGDYQGTRTALSVNLNPGTYILRAYLPLGERQDVPVGGNYSITYNTAAVVDNAAPVVVASAFQYEIAPVGVSFNVDQDVAGSVDAGDVLIRNLGTNATFAVDRVFYDPATRRLGYGVAQRTLPDGNYRATLLAGSIRDASMNPLANDATLDFFVFAGDANRDRAVNLADFSILASRFNQPGTFSQGDFNYNHVTDIADFSILASRFNTTLPAARGAANASAPPASDPTEAATGVSSPRAVFADRRGLFHELDDSTGLTGQPV